MNLPLSRPAGTLSPVAGGEGQGEAANCRFTGSQHQLISSATVRERGAQCLAGRIPLCIRYGRQLSFTLIELLVVIGIIALLASLIVGLTSYAGRTMRERRIRAELDKLVTAIEAYHAKFNQYPPDNFDPVTKTVNPVTNSLYYELTGVIADDRGDGRFRLANRQQWIGTQQVKLYFHTDGFVNSGNSEREIKQFAEFKAEQHKAIASSPADLEVLTVPVDWPLNNPSLPPPFDAITDPKVKRINPIRYVGHPHATNNPDGFDLWAEYVDGGRVRIICNWSKDVLER